jgi:hypothetical protein
VRPTLILLTALWITLLADDISLWMSVLMVLSELVTLSDICEW